MTKVVRLIDGVETIVTLCPASRRRAASSIQQKRYQVTSHAALWMAWDTGKKVIVKNKNR